MSLPQPSRFANSAPFFQTPLRRKNSQSSRAEAGFFLTAHRPRPLLSTVNSNPLTQQPSTEISSNSHKFRHPRDPKQNSSPKLQEATLHHLSCHARSSYLRQIHTKRPTPNHYYHPHKPIFTLPGSYLRNQLLRNPYSSFTTAFISPTEEPLAHEGSEIGRLKQPGGEQWGNQCIWKKSPQSPGWQKIR
jgi:hypothetical protein